MPEPQNTNELLIRLDERAVSIQREIKQLNDDISEIKNNIKENRAEYIKQFVTKEEFAPVQRSIYGIVSLILVTVIGTVLSLVIHKGAL